MSRLRKFQRKENTSITAVRLDLDTEGFTYQKWGGTQHCKPGDWLVNDAGETYTIDAQTFAKTYREVSPAVYAKESPIWAEEATASGTILTKEGSTDFLAGDFLVFNDAARQDGYAVKAEIFHTLYELAGPRPSGGR